MTWGAIGGVAVATVGGALLGGGGGGGGGGSQTQTTQQQLDPRIGAMLFGDGTDANKGLLSQYQGYLNQPQGAGTSAYQQHAQDYLKNTAPGVVNQLQNSAAGLLTSNISAPQSQGASPQSQGPGSPALSLGGYSSGTNVNAPAQNNLDLSGAYDKVINGNAGANPYLTQALQSGVDQTQTAYDRNQINLTNNLQRNVLPGIRSNAVLAGQYGGTRQGIAEGNALSDYTNQLSSSNLALAQANSANTTGAQAQAFNQGQDRSLTALQGLSGQQYGVASQNASMGQQNNLFNAGQQQQNNQFNANQRQQGQNLLQQNNQFNATQQQQNNQFNANQQANTNALNSNNQLSGLAAQSGLLSSLYGIGQNQDNAGINRANQVNGLLAPYLSANGSVVNTSPLYSNTGANILGGATAGLGLYNGLKNSGMFGNTFTGGSGAGGSSLAPVSTGGYNMPDLSSALSFGYGS